MPQNEAELHLLPSAFGNTVRMDGWLDELLELVMCLADYDPAAAFERLLDCWLVRLNSCFSCAYLLYQLAAIYAAADERAIQQQVGLLQGALVLSVVALNLLYVCVQTAAVAVKLAKRCRRPPQ